MFRIPIPKTGGEVLNEGIQNLMERLMKEKQIQNEAQYRNATLQLAAQKENREAQLNPAYMQYYGAMGQQAQAAADKSRQEQEQNTIINQIIQDAMNPQNSTSNQSQQNGQQTGQPNKPKIPPAVAAWIKQKTGYDAYAQTPEEKASMEANKQIEAAQGKEDIKLGRTIQNSARDLNGLLSLVKQAKDIIKNNPGNTGWTEGSLVAIKKSKNPHANKLHTIFGEIQGKASRLYNPRGGIGTINWAKSIKPTVFNGDEANLAQLDAIEENAQSTLNQYGEEYQDVTKKPLFSKNSKTSNITKWKMENGKLVKE